MSSITSDQKQLLFDYSLGLTSESESAQAQTLISTNEEAAEIHKSLQTALAPLETLDPEPCPDALAEHTISRLVDLANSGHHALEELLATEQHRSVTVKVGFWRHFREMVALAATILIVATVLLSVFKHERQKNWQQRCQMQLSSIFQGLGNYLSDHDGKPPTVVAKPNQSWNTQHLYLLVRLHYVKNPTIFICPGRRQGRASQLDPEKLTLYTDFPTRESITYSPRKRCPNTLTSQGLCRGPILADRNPIFEDMLKKKLDKTLLNANSRNHQGKGQNVLSDDGSVKFMKIRHIGAAKDDIFTVKDMCCGSEVDEHESLPFSEADVFLAP